MRCEGGGAAGDKRFLLNETFIKGSGTNEYVVRRAVCCFLWLGNYSNSCHGLLGNLLFLRNYAMS